MLRLGIAIEETWSFFNEVYAELNRHHQTTLFRRRSWQLPVFYARSNQWLLHHDLSNFMKASEVVFFEWASELLALATHLPKVCGIVVRLHRYEMYQWVDRINWDAVDRVIVVSRAKQREFVARFPSQAGKVEVLPPSIPLEKFTFQPKAFRGDIGILCHLSPRKRVYDLLLAFYDLTRDKTGYHLHIAGGSDPAFRDYYEALLYLIEELKLENSVTMYGHVNEPWNWYHNVDIFVSNSYSEGLQVAPVEAAASGCYCLSHHWDGAEELLPNENLYHTSNDLIVKILEYGSLPDSERQARIAAGRALACERFDIHNTAIRIREIIEATASAYAT